MCFVCKFVQYLSNKTVCLVFVRAQRLNCKLQLSSCQRKHTGWLSMAVTLPIWQLYKKRAHCSYQSLWVKTSNYKVMFEFGLYVLISILHLFKCTFCKMQLAYTPQFAWGCICFLVVQYMFWLVCIIFHIREINHFWPDVLQQRYSGQLC